MKSSWLKLVISLSFCFLVAFAGSVITTPSINSWYQALTKPSFNPPNWIFGPVWLLLYSLMGISLFLVWREKQTKKTRVAITFFGIQLLLNFLWSFLFFYLHLPTLALIEIFILWLAIFFTIKKFRPISKTASLLLIPYLLWVSFASILNLAIVLLN